MMLFPDAKQGLREIVEGVRDAVAELVRSVTVFYVRPVSAAFVAIH
jgi:hypothetical protein